MVSRGWYRRLPLAFIHSFDQFTREFEANFLASTRPKPTAASLLGMRQKEDEPLGLYLAQFTREIEAITDAHPSLVIQAFMVGIRPSSLFWSLMERTPTIVPEMLQRANQYVIAEALVAEKREDQKCPQAESSRGSPPTPSRKRIERAGQTISRIREKGLLKAHNPMRNVGRDCGRYCRFHWDYGHDTKECYDLKNQIEDLIRWGHLNRFIRRSREPSLCPKGLVEKQIDVIVGGPAASDDSSSARKAYACVEVQKRPHGQSNPEITFESE
ncbi:hypothetical protein B296_00052024, partial [Ensete ventricosum]